MIITNEADSPDTLIDRRADGTPVYETPGFNVIAELQRQQTIIDDARRSAEDRGAQPPASGMPGYEPWARQMLVLAGESYTITRGEKVALHTVPAAAWPSGLPDLFVPPTTVAELLDAAAALVERNGWHQGPGLTGIRFNLAVYFQPVTGHAALLLAAGFNPNVATRLEFTAPALAVQAEEVLGEYLMVRGELPQYDRDWFVDAGAIIDGYEQDLGMTGPELVEMWRDCAAWVRGGCAR